MSKENNRNNQELINRRRILRSVIAGVALLGTGLWAGIQYRSASEQKTTATTTTTVPPSFLPGSETLRNYHSKESLDQSGCGVSQVVSNKPEISIPLSSLQPTHIILSVEPQYAYAVYADANNGIGIVLEDVSYFTQPGTNIQKPNIHLIQDKVYAIPWIAWGTKGDIQISVPNETVTASVDATVSGLRAASVNIVYCSNGSTSSATA